MSTNVYRGPLTDTLIQHLMDGLQSFGQGVPVGDGVVPKGAGWNGEPNLPTSNFRSYVVVIAGPASQSSGPMGDSQGDWKFPYMLGSYGSSRKMCDWMADRARALLGDLRGEVYSLGEDDYSVQYVQVNSIGGTNRIDATDPPYWGQTDGLTLWMTKEH